MSETPDARTVRTVPFRLSFPHLPPMPPQTDKRSGRQTFNQSMLFPPGTDMTPFENALTAARVEKHGPETKGRAWPRIKRKPADVIKDFAQYNADSKTPLAGDWTGWKMIPCSTGVDYPPSVVHNYKDPETGKWARVTDKREIFGGRWARAEIQAYEYANDGGGVTFGLRMVQLLKRDTPFGVAPANPDRGFGDDVPEEYKDDGDAFERGEPAKGSAPATAGGGWD